VKPQIETLPVLVLYPHGRCNCRCIMCDIWKDPTRAQISVEELARHLEDIERLRVQWVVFSGGEPLMHSDLFRLADMLRTRGIRVTVLSTGLLLKRYASEIAASVDDLILSLDGPPAVHDRIRRVPGAADLMRKGMAAVLKRNPAFAIAARCTVQRANHDVLLETARFAADSGFQSLSFLAADLTTTAFNREVPWGEDRQFQVALTQEQTEKLAGQFALLAEEWSGTAFIKESKEKLQRIVRHFRSHLGLDDPESPRCNAPWVSAVVESDGTVRPCFFQRPIGSLRTQSLLQVLNGFEAQTFRMSLDVATDPVCKRCVCSLHWKE
jgi:Fe-coproporphyrin III synthase